MWRAAVAACLSYVLLVHAVLSAPAMAPSDVELRPDLAALYTVCAGDADGSPGQSLPDHGHHEHCTLCAVGHCGAAVPPVATTVRRPDLVVAAERPRGFATLMVSRRPRSAAAPRGPPASA
jgi:hypothetical protein